MAIRNTRSRITTRDDLDSQLQAICATRSNQLPAVQKSMVKRIKATFKDAGYETELKQPFNKGWKSGYDTAEYTANKGLEEYIQLQVHDRIQLMNTMTGQQFADRMEAELKAYPSNEPFPPYVHTVIRRAAGLSDD